MALAWFNLRLRALDLRRVVESDDGERLEVTFAPAPRGIWQVAQFAWGFALVHYIFYGVLVALAAYLARDSIIARVLAALAVIAYQPSFWDGSERKLGRPWDALRTHPVWTLPQAYFPSASFASRRSTPPESTSSDGTHTVSSSYPAYTSTAACGSACSRAFPSAFSARLPCSACPCAARSACGWAPSTPAGPPHPAP